MTSVFSEEMSIFVRFFQLFSLFPISANALLNVVLQFYSVVTLLLIVGIFISSFFILPILTESESLSFLVGGLVFIGLLFTHLINIIQGFTSRHEQLLIYQKFDEIDLLLQNQLLVGVSYAKLRKRLLFKYFIILTLVCGVHVTSLVAVTVTSGSDFRYYFYLIFPILIIRIRCIQNMFYVDLIKEKLMLVNFKLDDIVRKNKDKMAFILFADKLQKFNQKKSMKSSLYEQLMTLKQIYGKVWDISNLINDCFGWSLLTIVE